MNTLLRECRRAKSAAVAAVFFVALATTSIAHGQITYLKSCGGFASPVEASAASVNAVPEPGTLGLLAVGAIGLVGSDYLPQVVRQAPQDGRSGWKQRLCNTRLITVSA